MVDYKPSILSTLQTIDTGAQYELFCDSSTGLPRITYAENNNYEDYQGDTLGYSTISFTIKVQDTAIAHAEQQAASIDNKMRGLGFKRTACNELIYNEKICKIMTYSALFHEDYVTQNNNN